MQAANTAPSRPHSKVAPTSPGASNSIAVVVLLSICGGTTVRTVSGASVSMRQAKVAGLGSSLFEVSIARTSKAWLPSTRPLIICGDEQSVGAPPSIRQRNVAASLAVNSNRAGRVLVSNAGLIVIIVSGAARSSASV